MMTLEMLAISFTVGQTGGVTVARTSFARASKLVALSEIVKLKEWCIFKYFLRLLVFGAAELLKVQVCGHTAASNKTGTCVKINVGPVLICYRPLIKIPAAI